MAGGRPPLEQFVAGGSSAATRSASSTSSSGCGSYWLTVFEEVTGVQLVGAEAFPLFHAWLRDF